MNIDEFAEQMGNLKTDGKLNWARVVDADPQTREEFFENIEPRHDGARDIGLALKFETASGAEFREWFLRPEEWNAFRYDLPLIVEYLGIEPSELSVLSEGSDTDEIYEVPILMTSDGRTVDIVAIEEEVYDE